MTTKSALAIQVMQKMISDRSFNRLHVDATVRQYPEFRSVIGEQMARLFLDEFGRWEEYFPTYFNSENILSLSPVFMMDICDGGIESLSWFIETFDSALKDVTDARWISTLRGEDDILALALARRRVNGGYPPADKLRSAIIKHASGLLSGTESKANSPFAISDILRLFRKVSRDRLVEMVYKALPHVGPFQDRWDLFFGMYGGLLASMPLARSPAATIDKILIPMINSHNRDTENTLQAVAPQLPAVLMAASPTARTRLEKSTTKAKRNEALKTKASAVAKLLKASGRRRS